MKTTDLKIRTFFKPILLILFFTNFINIQHGLAEDDLSKTDTTAGLTASADPQVRVIDVMEFDLDKDTIKENAKIRIKLNTVHTSQYKTLYVHGIPVKNASVLYNAGTDSVIIFQLQGLNTIPLFKSWEGQIIKVKISVGQSEKQHVPSNSYLFINMVPKLDSLNVWPWLIAIGVLMIFLIIISLRDQILKDDHNVYYSLGRVQLFYWTLLIIFVYLYIWYITRELPAISNTVLAILGISTVTSGASKVIENEANKTPVKIDPKAKSDGILYDILSDGSSISIHRFQNVAFNLIIGAIFLQKATTTHAFPEFDNNVLILLGMSSGTYTALKITEAKKSETPETAANPVPVTIPPDTPEIK